MKHLINVLFAVVITLTSFNIASAEDKYEKKVRLSIDAPRFILGVPFLSAEYKPNNKVGIGITSIAWEAEEETFYQEDSFTAKIPYGRYYFNETQNGWLVSCGYVSINYKSINLNNTVSNFKRSGLYLESGYQWQNNNFFQELTYAWWSAKDVNNENGTDLSLAGGPRLLYKIGLQF